LAKGRAAYDREDYALARRYFAASAARGEAEAMYRLGQLYALGHGVVRHPPDALSWYERAAELGDMNARFELSLAYLRGQPDDRRTRPALWYKFPPEPPTRRE
jgi:TPR repeat protein